MQVLGWFILVQNRPGQPYYLGDVVKFIYSEKAAKFCEIFPLLLTVFTAVKSKGKTSQNFVAFSEYMNFKISIV